MPPEENLRAKFEDDRDDIAAECAVRLNYADLVFGTRSLEHAMQGLMAAAYAEGLAARVHRSDIANRDRIADIDFKRFESLTLRARRLVKAFEASYTMAYRVDSNGKGQAVAETEERPHRHVVARKGHDPKHDRGKPYTPDELKQLTEMIQAKTPMSKIALVLNRTEGALYQTIRRLREKGQLK